MSKRERGPKPTFHELKSWPQFFWAMEQGTKTFDMREEKDRQFEVGDLLLVRYWDPEPSEIHDPWEAEDANCVYSTPAPLLFEVTFCMRERPWVPKGFVCMGLRRVGLELTHAG